MKHIFIPLRKVDEAQRLVYGIAAVEQVDKTREILDYESSKPLFEEWSAEFAKATDGLSLGNVREMHGKSAAGKLTQFAPNDEQKSFEVCAKVVDDQAWKKVLEGVYTGFSIGGDYARKWDDPTLAGVKRYTAKPSEVSLVDNPCIPGATFEAIKADGTSELRKFAEPTVEQLQKRVTALEARLAKADKPNEPLYPGAKLTAAEFIAQAEASGNVEAFAGEYIKANFPRATAKLEKAVGAGTLQKSLYDVGSLASMLQSLAYMVGSLEYEAEREDDNSPVPGRLRDVLKTLKQIFIDLATEEANELVAEEGLERAASAATLQKAAPAANSKGGGSMATKLTLQERLTKATPDELTKFVERLVKAADVLKTAGKHLEAAVKAHEKMGDHLDGMADCVGKAASAGTLEKANGDHLTGHLTGMREAHGEMEDAHDGIEGALQDMADVAGEDTDENMAANQRKNSEKMMKRMERSFEKRMKASEASHQAQLAAVLSGIEKAFGGGQVTEQPTPARTAITVDRQQDGTGVTKTVPTGAAPTTSATVQQVSPVLPDGMPNPAWVEKLEASNGAAFTKAASTEVKQQIGNPFPEQFGKVA